MVHNRKERVEARRGAIEEVGKTVREVCGEEEEDEDAKDGRGKSSASLHCAHHIRVVSYDFSEHTHPLNCNVGIY